MGLINVSFTLVAAAMMDKMGRKPLLQASFAGMAGCLAVVALIIYVPSEYFGKGECPGSTCRKPIMDNKNHVSVCMYLYACIFVHVVQYACLGICVFMCGCHHVCIRTCVSGCSACCCCLSAMYVSFCMQLTQLLSCFLARSAASLAVQGMLTVTFILLYVCAFALGVGPIPWIVLSEILPPRIKGPAASLATTCCWAGNLLVTLSFNSMLDTLGIGGSYLLYAAFNCFGLWYVSTYMVETKCR